MKLSKNQIDILTRINQKLEHGDITEIAKRADFTIDHTWRVLNPELDAYNDKIVATAVDLIAEREQGRKQMLEKMSA